MNPVLVLYVPALHRGYDELFRQAVQLGAEELYILDSSIIDQYPLLKREIRQLEPASAVKAVQGLGYFRRVDLASRGVLRTLGESGLPVILSEESLPQELQDQYFPANPVTRLPVFLRWDEQSVAGSVGVTAYDCQISQDSFDRQVMERAGSQTRESSDWFRRVGAALVLEGEVRMLAHNTRMPSPHEPWTVGDPRNYMEYGQADPHLRSVLHAEELLLVRCAREGIKVEGGWVYATTFPCPACADLIAASGLARCYFRDGYAALNGDAILKAYGVEIIRVT